jgi:hypothetical protein
MRIVSRGTWQEQQHTRQDTPVRADTAASVLPSGVLHNSHPMLLELCRLGCRHTTVPAARQMCSSSLVSRPAAAVSPAQHTTPEPFPSLPHRSMYSLPPGKFLICHTSALFSGAYTAEPCSTNTTTAAAQPQALAEPTAKPAVAASVFSTAPITGSTCWRVSAA